MAKRPHNRKIQVSHSDRYLIKEIDMSKVMVPDVGAVTGLCDNASKVIYIDRNDTGEDKMRTLLHEIVHAYFYAQGWQQIDGFSVQFEHLIAESLTKFLYDTFDIKLK